jgi:hypothetical protein
MNAKKRNTWLFVAGATVFNLLVTVVLLVLGYVVIILVRSKALGGNMNPNVLNLLLVADLAISFILSRVIYDAILKALGKKIDFDKHFDPIFKSRGRAD